MDGGNSIRFGRVDSPSTKNQEVRIRATSTEETQYQVSQRIVEPFRNERGETLDFDAIVVSSLPGSSSSGTLELQNVEQLSYAEQVVYTSSNNGISDSFVLIYQVNPEKIKTSGNFSGEIIYTLRPVSGGSSQEQVILNAFLEISSDLNVRTETSTGTDVVRLRSGGKSYKDDYFRLTFEGNRGNMLKVYQEIVQFPTDEDNKFLDADLLDISLIGGEKGQVNLTEASPLSRKRTLLYSSDAEKDDVRINFHLNEGKESSESGHFIGKMNYVIESDVYNQTFPVDLEVEIEPVFELLAEFPLGGMSFKGLLPNSEPQYKEVIVTVNSNTGKPYSVSQNTQDLLTNEKGEQIAEDYFTVKQEIMESGAGRVESSDFSPVRNGETPLYYSDRNGSSVKFKVTYRLRPFKGMQAGDYKTSVVFTLGEI
ncbi:MAG: hypothetical protein KBD53_04200 [Candidatus Omnitrophica bacterium]|nr:hypothetical protein [Candidatus Omnitrophota bacterium]